jgi:hypothetical protein
MRDRDILVKRIKRNVSTGQWEEAKTKGLFIRGPIPMPWVERVAQLPGKALALALGLWWLHGMAKGGEVTVSRKMLERLNLSRDAAADGLTRLERAGLIRVRRAPGKRPRVHIVTKTEQEIGPPMGPLFTQTDHGSCV